MKKTSLVLLSLVATLLAAAQPKLVPLTILHWNDFHAHNLPYKPWPGDFETKVEGEYTVGGSALFAGYVKKYRNESPNVLVLNAGDDFQGTVISTITYGKSQIELMNIIKPDAVTLGNHEFDYGTNRLKENLRAAQYPVLVANVYDTLARRTFVKPTHTVSVGGLTIGLLGLTHPRLEILVLKDSLVGITLLNIDSVVSWHVGQLKKQNVDLIVAITHMGRQNDSLLAMRHPEIGVIVGGHDHWPLPTPWKVNRTIIVQAEKWGRFLGKLDLVVDATGDSVYSAAGRLIETRAGAVEPDPVAAKKVEELTENVQEAMGVVIGELKTPWTESSKDGCNESNVGNWQADVFLQYAKSDIAFQNATGIRKFLNPGPITVGDIWEMNPFGNYCVTFEVDGATLRSMLEFQVSYATGQECIQVGGLRFTYDSRKPRGERLVSVEVQGKRLESSSRYTVATNNYVVSSLQAHFGINQKTMTLTSLPKLDRDIFIDAIRKAKIIDTRTDGRIKDLAEK